MENPIKFKKVVKYYFRDDGTEYEGEHNKSQNYWTSMFLDWLVSLTMVLLIPIVLIPMRSELRKEVYWRKIK